MSIDPVSTNILRKCSHDARSRPSPPSWREQYSSSRNVLHLTGRVINVTRYRLPRPLVGSAVQDHVTAGLVHLGQKEQYLRVAIADEDSLKPLFVSVSDLDIADHVSWHKIPGNLASYEEALFGAHGLIQADVDKNWPLALETTRPPWCVKVYMPELAVSGDAANFIDIAFSAHHAVCDGMSGRIFHEALLNALCSPTASSDAQSTKLRFSEPAAVHDAQEALIPFRSSVSFFANLLWSEFAPSWLKWAPILPWTGPPIDIYRPMSSGFSFIKLSAGGSARILSACRKHNTTLTALLHTLILKSLLKTVKELQAPNATTRSCTAIDLRRLLPADIPRNTLGDYVAGLTHGFAPSDVTALRDARTLPATSTTAAGMDRLGEEVWRVSSAIKADINAQISLLPADNAAGLLSWVSDFRARWANKNGEQRGEAWEVSNLGAMEVEVVKHITESRDATEGFKLEQVVFTQSGMVVGPALGVNVAGIKKGPVCLTITWQRHKDVDDAAEGVARDLKDWLGQDEES
ncbi:Alcohol acetyltransferase [Ceratocystis pirilliformis]|uniref:Alcohol acetyltransferase n=1 Tax=Ceratocystis pirilliformis TaxID=259994 RepID=A0ABR3Z8G9_9PEZI